MAIELYDMKVQHVPTLMIFEIEYKNKIYEIDRELFNVVYDKNSKYQSYSIFKSMFRDNKYLKRIITSTSTESTDLFWMNLINKDLKIQSPSPPKPPEPSPARYEGGFRRRRSPTYDEAVRRGGGFFE